MNTIVIGRHAPEGLGLEVVEQRNSQLPATSQGCKMFVADLMTECSAKGIESIIFQMCPAQLAVALAQMKFESGVRRGKNFVLRQIDAEDEEMEIEECEFIKVGFVISKPGARPDSKTRTFESVDGSGMFHADIAGAVRFANPRATVSEDSAGVQVKVEAPMPFEFDHIEWL